MIWTCFDLDSYTTDDQIQAIATKIEASSSEDAALIFAGKRFNSLDFEESLKNVVVVGEGFRDIWEVELRLTPTFETVLLESREVEENE